MGGKLAHEALALHKLAPARSLPMMLTKYYTRLTPICKWILSYSYAARSILCLTEKNKLICARLNVCENALCCVTSGALNSGIGYNTAECGIYSQ